MNHNVYNSESVINDTKGEVALTQVEAAPSAPFVSVIIPAYNVAPYIKEALDSVFAQTYRSFEAIVVNDGSPDTAALEEVLAPYRSRIVYLQQENRGLAGARNTGLRAATGDLVALLDADDVWTPDYLQEQVGFLQQHPEIDLVYCNSLFFGKSIHAGTTFMDLCPSEGEATASALITRRCHVFVSVTARRPVLASVGFDESLRSCEDFDCWLRLTAAGYRIGYQRKLLVRYRKHDTSLSANPTWMAEHNIKVLNKALSLWPPGSKEHQEVLSARAEKTAQLETIKAKIALRDQRIPDAVLHLKAANSFYNTVKLSVIITILHIMPGTVRALARLRGFFFPAHRGI
jgi:glycosyltransferase involved in cell wall biosynthesis